MDDLAGAGGEFTPEDDGFTVSQDTEFEEPADDGADEERGVDDGLADDRVGIDAERRVDLRDDRRAPSDDDD